ncbi:MAG: diacylglycerol kinase family protein [Chloroflexi bacterium]|nr:diacylglycerol kinase family protein [Chloroflexota bacterium]
MAGRRVGGARVPSPVQAELSRLARAFRYAGRGWLYVLRTQRNARWHLAATLGVGLAGWWFSISRLEAGLLILAIGLVWAAEALNTALEALADRCAPEPHPLVAAAKDAAAAGVLAAALSAIGVGIAVFGPYLLGMKP